MDVQLEDISTVEKKLTFTIPVETVDEEISSAYRTLKREIMLPGFRPGRVPRKLLEQRFGQQISGEVSSKLISDAYDKAVEDHDLEPVSTPDVDEGDLEGGQPFTFSVSVEVKPRFTLESYNGVKIVWPRGEVTDEEVSEQIESMQRQAGKLVQVEEERPVEDGDVVTANVKMVAEGMEDYVRDGLMMSVPDDPYFGFLVELCQGAVVGEPREGEVSVPAEFFDGDWAGQTCQATVEITEMKKLESRELDDQFAKDMGHESVDVMTAAIRFRIQEAKDKRSRDGASRRLIDKLVRRNPFDVPTQLVRQRGNALVGSIAAQMMPGMDQASQFSLDDLDEEKQANVLTEAEFSVRRELVLAAMVKQEELTISEDEIDARVQSLAGETGQRPETLRGYLLKSGGMEELKERMLQDKAIDLLLERAEIVDSEEDEDDDVPAAPAEPAPEPAAPVEDAPDDAADSVSSEDEDSVSSDDEDSVSSDDEDSEETASPETPE